LVGAVLLNHENDGGAVVMVRLALITLLFTVPLSASAESVQGNPLIGRQTATTLCASCHRTGETRQGGAPSFLDIANMPSTTALSLKVFLGSNHKAMPNLIISNADTDDLIAYILSLKQPSVPNRL
jgi:mono/diheme cytochrome c family protein